MLKTTVNNGAKKLGFEEEITETGAVNSDISLLHNLLSSTSSSILASSILGGLGSGGNLDDLLLLFIINKLVSRVSHSFVFRSSIS